MTDTPQPHGAVPSARQLAWHELELYGFVHFTVNTFTDREWGYGDEPPAVFAPTDFSADQIAQAARDGGLRGLILTAKHHDGFCLWPSAYTEHSVASSPWRAGKGDVVRELSEACRALGLTFGVYLSPWDRNHAEYGRPAYIAYYRNQLRELLTGYGELFEVWFDGANGGDGYYGGARETRSIDRHTYYDWSETWRLVRSLQPSACIFSDAGPDVRWVGNERGIAGDPCWATIDRRRFAPGDADAAGLNSGERGAPDWVPAECDVSIRPGWFYHAAEDTAVKTPDQLIELYFQSVGRGASLLLNLPPDRRGRIPDADVAALRAFRQRLNAIFAENLAADASLSASSVWAQNGNYAPERALDGDRDTFWCAAAGDHAPEMVLEFSRPVQLDVVFVREYLPLGQRVDRWIVEAWIGDTWRPVARGQAIGARRLARFAPITTDRLRLRFPQPFACPAICDIGVYHGLHAAS